MGLWRFKIPNSMLLGLSYFLLNREMSDLGLHHIPKTLQRGNFFSESALRVTGKITESFKPFSSHKYPCVLDFHWSNKTQPTKNLWWLLNTWMGITKHSTTCFIFLEKHSLILVRAAPGWDRSIFLTLPASAQLSLKHHVPPAPRALQQHCVFALEDYLPYKASPQSGTIWGCGGDDTPNKTT